jgi:hypothetical protein
VCRWDAPCTNARRFAGLHLKGREASRGPRRPRAGRIGGCQRFRRICRRFASAVTGIRAPADVHRKGRRGSGRRSPIYESSIRWGDGPAGVLAGRNLGRSAQPRPPALRPAARDLARAWLPRAVHRFRRGGRRDSQVERGAMGSTMPERREVKRARCASARTKRGDGVCRRDGVDDVWEDGWAEMEKVHQQRLRQMHRSTVIRRAEEIGRAGREKDVPSFLQAGSGG